MRPIRNDQRSVFGRGHHGGHFSHLQPHGRPTNVHPRPLWSSERQSVDGVCRPTNRHRAAQDAVDRKRPYRDLDAPAKEPCLTSGPAVKVEEEAEDGEIVDPTPSPSPPIVEELPQARSAPSQMGNSGCRQVGRRCTGRQRTDDSVVDEFEKELRAAELDSVRGTSQGRSRCSHQVSQTSPYQKHQRKRHVGLSSYPALDADKILRHLTEGQRYDERAFEDTGFVNDGGSFQRPHEEEAVGVSSPAKRIRSEEHRATADDADELCRDFGDVLVISKTLAKEHKLVLLPATFGSCDEFGDKWRDFKKHMQREYKQYNGCSRLAKPLTNFGFFSVLKEYLDAHELSAKENTSNCNGPVEELNKVGAKSTDVVDSGPSSLAPPMYSNGMMPEFDKCGSQLQAIQFGLNGVSRNALPNGPVGFHPAVPPPNYCPSQFAPQMQCGSQFSNVFARPLPPQRNDRMPIMNEGVSKEPAPVIRNKPANCGDINSPTLELLSKWAANNLKNFPLTSSLLPQTAQPTLGMQNHRSQQHFTRATPFISQVHRHSNPLTMTYQSGRIGRRNPVVSRQIFGDPERMRDDIAKITSALLELRRHYVLRNSFR